MVLIEKSVPRWSMWRNIHERSSSFRVLKRRSEGQVDKMLWRPFRPTPWYLLNGKALGVGIFPHVKQYFHHTDTCILQFYDGSSNAGQSSSDQSNERKINKEKKL